MKRNFALLVGLACAVSTAIAATDYQCVNDCTKRYQYNYCISRCSYEDDSERMLRQQQEQMRQQQQQRQSQQIQQFQTKTTDFQCQSDCIARGYMYNYCNAKCSY